MSYYTPSDCGSSSSSYADYDQGCYCEGPYQFCSACHSPNDDISSTPTHSFLPPQMSSGPVNDVLRFAQIQGGVSLPPTSEPYTQKRTRYSSDRNSSTYDTEVVHSDHNSYSYSSNTVTKFYVDPAHHAPPQEEMRREDMPASSHSQYLPMIEGLSLGSSGSQSARSAHGGSQSPRSAHGGYQNPRSAHGESQSPRYAHGGSQSARSAHGGSQSPRSAHGESQSPRSAHGGSQSARSAHGGSSSSRSVLSSASTIRGPSGSHSSRSARPSGLSHSRNAYDEDDRASECSISPSESSSHIGSRAGSRYGSDVGRAVVKYRREHKRPEVTITFERFE